MTSPSMYRALANLSGDPATTGFDTFPVSLSQDNHLSTLFFEFLPIDISFPSQMPKDRVPRREPSITQIPGLNASQSFLSLRDARQKLLKILEDRDRSPISLAVVAPLDQCTPRCPHLCITPISFRIRICSCLLACVQPNSI